MADFGIVSGKQIILSFNNNNIYSRLLSALILDDARTC